MTQRRIDLPFPARGISERFGFSYQEDGTSRDERNMRSQDPRTSRLRGAQRSGLGLYAGGGQANGSEKIKAMAAVSTTLSPITWTQNLTGTKDWENDGESNGNIIDLKRGPFGSFVAVTDEHEVLVLNSDGEPHHTIQVPKVKPGSGKDRVICSCVHMDPEQNIFVGTAAITSDMDPLDCALYIYRFNEDDTYTLVHTLLYDQSVLDVCAEGNQMYVLTCDEALGLTGYDAGLAGGADSIVTWQLHTYTNYQPFNVEPAEDLDRRFSTSVQCRPADADVPAEYEQYMTCDQLTGRIGCRPDGSVVVSVAVIGQSKQEYGGLFWVDPFATDADGNVGEVASAEQYKWYYLTGVPSVEGGYGLFADWSTETDGDLQVLACGDPVVKVSRQLEIDATPTSVSYLDVHGVSDSGGVDRRVRFYWSGSANDNASWKKTPVDRGATAFNAEVYVTSASWLSANAGDFAAIGQKLADAFGFVNNNTDYQTWGTATRCFTAPANPEQFYLTSPCPHADVAASYATTSKQYGQAIIGGTDWLTNSLSVEWDAGAHATKFDTNISSTGYAFTGGANAFDVSLGGTWFNSTPNSWMRRFSQDQNYGAYLPWGNSSANSTYDEKNALFIKSDYSSGDLTAFTCTSLVYAQAVAAPLDVIDYNGAAIDHAHYIVLAGPKVGGSSAFKFFVASTAQAVTAPRAVNIAAVAGNKVVKVLEGSIVEPHNNAVIDSASPYVHATAGFQKIYIADGVNYWVYDPNNTDNSANGEVSQLRCTTFGEIPERCRLIEFWRGRLVLARDPADPGRWSMSAIGDPTDWEYFPIVETATKAASAQNTRAGAVPDIINALVPWTDDTLLFGGDRSIVQLTGDPVSGGVLDMVTNETGMAFGRPYCIDSTGGLWFFGSTGGLYNMVRGAAPRRVSLGRVEKQLRNIDLDNYYVLLAWNPIDEGVHIYQVPFANPGTIVDHWFYEARADAWHKDRYGAKATDLIQPTATVRIDGDVYDDRTLMLGCEDGRFRTYARDASGNVPKSDQKTTVQDIAIDSYVLMGPLVQNPVVNTVQISELSALLSSSQHGCRFEIFSTDDPEQLGSAVASGKFDAGRNDSRLIRANGEHVYLRMRNASLGESWAFEGASASIAYGGHVRAR